MITPAKQEADVCLILEGTYPYIAGGVSNWTHDLILGLPELRFHLLTIVPPQEKLVLRYKIPDNVAGISHVVLQDLSLGAPRIRHQKQLFANLEEPLKDLHSRGSLSDLDNILNVVAPYKEQLGRHILLDSQESWELLLKMYKAQYSESSFLDYFWSWRNLVGGLFSVLLTDIPRAGLYHAVSTGYAGLLAAKARLEIKRPAILTEHGIYTNERRIEISMSDWLHEKPLGWLCFEKINKDLKDLWIDTFINYSQICYEASSEIITLFPGNQKFQIADGALPEKLSIIPNGIDYPVYSQIPRKEHSRPTIALIGRVVPIKDVKTFIRACAILRDKIPDLQAYIIGPTDEDEMYFRECQEVVRFLQLQKTVIFTGKVKLTDYLGGIDVNVLTSISEGQPLVILEVGAMGIPSVATNVGACSELILGNELESPAVGTGGTVTRLSNPGETAKAIADLLTNKKRYEQCSQACKERVRRYYDKAALLNRYRELYQNYLSDHIVPQLLEV